MNRFSTDIHQHLWPQEFVRALRKRHEPPRLRGWTLELPGCEPFAIDPRDHDPATWVEFRTLSDRNSTHVLDRVAISPSAALGVREPAAWLEGALALGDPFLVWAGAGLRDPSMLRDALRAGAIGLEIAAGELSDLDAVAPLLDVLQEEDAALLVHPGPAADAGRPAWWSPVVDYVGQLHAAWWAWADGGRARFPALRVCFAALAGLGPLHGERARARGGPRGPVDPLTFVETSSYGTRAVDAVVRVLGIDVVCFGSDRPYAEPAPLMLDPAAERAIGTVNPGRLLARAPKEVPA